MSSSEAGTPRGGRPHTSRLQKAQLEVAFLEGVSSISEIAGRVGCSVRTVQRHAKVFKATGTIYRVGRSPYNAIKLPEPAFQDLLDHLRAKPDLLLEDMQRFLRENYNVDVNVSTISKRLSQAKWSKQGSTWSRQKQGKTAVAPRGRGRQPVPNPRPPPYNTGVGIPRTGQAEGMGS